MGTLVNTPLEAAPGSFMDQTFLNVLVKSCFGVPPACKNSQTLTPILRILDPPLPYFRRPLSYKNPIYFDGGMSDISSQLKALGLHTFHL